MRGMIDDKHFNYWEDWFKKAYEIEEFSAFNTLWLSYFIAGGSLGQQNAQYAYKQVLQTVYTSNPDLVGVFFLASKCQINLISSQATSSYFYYYKDREISLAPSVQSVTDSR